MGEIEYAVKTAITSYPRGIAVGFGHRRLLFRGLTSLFVSIAVIATLVYCRPVSGLLVFLLPSMISLLITAWATHSHHSDLETDDPYAASRNIIDPIYNRLTGNLGYHTAHHERCGLHWSRLPELHDRIRDRIPDSCYYVPGGALGFLRDTFDTKATEISTNSSQGIKG